MKMVSVVIPVYKAEKHLHYCVDSLTRQDYKAMEIILVDDGSPDESGNICDSCSVKDDRIKVIHKKNGGVSPARNAGIDLARGDYVVFVDSDDYVEPGYIGRLVDAAEKFPNAGQVWCCFQTVAGYNYEEKNVHCKLKDEIEFYTRDQLMTLHNMWLDTMPFNKLYNLELIRHYQLRFDETLSLGEDWLFNLAYIDKLENASIIVIADPLYNYVRVGNESLDRRYREDMLDIYRRLNSTCERYLRQWGISDEQMKLFYDSRFFSYDKVLRNTFCSTKMSKHEMYKWNNRLMKSTEFQDILSKCTCYIHPLYRKAYESGNYRLIHMLDFIHKILREE